MRLVLASNSPRRKSLLEEMGLEFEVCGANVDETVEGDLSPSELVQMLAARKARAVADTLDDDAIVLGADTVVSFGGEVFGKPRDMAHAREMLLTFSDTTHEVYTGVCLCQGKRSLSAAVCTKVTFAPVSEREIDTYLACFNPLDKAGAYGIQDAGGLFVSRIDGDFYNVIGLPLSMVNRLLKTAFSCDLFAFAKREERK
ncbi:MAG: septum formation inhibitor Maf [Clostridia bacterium]|nr:septum formation inhibitor Maf [Clostridia bacterium]